MHFDILQGTVQASAIWIAVAIFVGAAVFALFAKWGLRQLGRLAKDTKTNLDDYLLGALGTPLFLAIALTGLYFGLVYLPFDRDLEISMRLWLFVGLVGVGIYAALAVLDALYRWYAEDVATTTKTTLDDRLVGILRVLTPLIGGGLGIVLMLGMLGFTSSVVNQWLATHGAAIGLMFVASVVIFFVVSAGLPKVVRDTVRKSMEGQTEEEVQKRADTLAIVLATTCQVIIIGATALMILNELLPGKIAPLLAGVGVAGIAVGFGAQSLVKDVINGVFVIMEGQYHVGDYVAIGGVSGNVESINLRRTTLRDPDGIVHFVPNGEIRVASNHTRGHSKINLNISVAYGTDLNKATGVINRIGQNLADDPVWKPSITRAPFVLRVNSFGDYGIELKVGGETKPMRKWDVMGELLSRIKTAFEAEGIEIPYPTTKVLFEGVPDGHRGLGISGRMVAQGQDSVPHPE